MDDVDRIIKEIVERFFREGHTKISTRTIASKTNISLRVVTAHIVRHDLDLQWERRSRGLIILSQVNRR
jgi:hypothetical protein